MCTCTNSRMWSSFPTWHATPRTSRPSPRSTFTVWSTFCCFLEDIMTHAPSWASLRAMPSPMPAQHAHKRPRFEAMHSYFLCLHSSSATAVTNTHFE